LQRLPKYKLAGPGYGLLSKQEVRIAPREEVAIDLIGPWKVKVYGQKNEFNALTCIDTALNLVKLIRIDNKTAKHIHDKFTQMETMQGGSSCTQNIQAWW
jgi:hypothetical protein